MVTKKREYPLLTRCRLTKRPIELAYMYRKSSFPNIEVSVRCDIRILEASLGNPLFLSLSDGPFILVKLHYRHLMATCEAMNVSVNISYDQFLDALCRVFRHAQRKSGVIITLSINAQGTMRARMSLEYDAFAYFGGFIDHCTALLLNDKARGLYKHFGQQPILVQIDSEATPPSFLTSFHLGNKIPYAMSYNRVNKVSEKGSDSVVEPKHRKSSPVVPLMYNPLQMIICAGEWIPAVFREGVWYVPHISSGGRNDVLRMFLLQAGLIQESLLKVQGLLEGEDILMISATKGVRRGKVLGAAPSPAYKYQRKPRLKPARLDDDEETEKKKVRKKADNDIPNTYTFRL